MSGKRDNVFALNPHPILNIADVRRRFDRAAKGFDDADFADGGSDRLIDAIVAWGDEEAIAARVQAHHDAGADHVCIQPFRADGQPGADLRILEALAPNAR